MTKVQEIHNAIDTAADRLLEEAKRIVGLNNIDIAVRLSKIGFTGTDAVIKSNKTVYSIELANLIDYHKKTYPFQKFITEDEMDRICKKYNLIYAPVSKYKKDVPEKNILEIERMPELKSNDYRSTEYVSVFKYNGILNIGETRAKLIGLPKKVNERFSSWIDADRYLKSKYPIVSHRDYIVNSVDVISIDKSGLFIAAPKSHFDLSGLRKSKFGFFNFTITEIKDPIVFRYVRGGIQVITKWGLEASDEAFVNETMN